MAIDTINVGAVANDGTGNPIRDAFTTVNQNFQFIQGGLFAGTEPAIINAVSVTGGHLISNSYVLASTYVNAASLVANTVTSNGNLYVSQDGAYIIGNVNIVGNLTVTGAQQSTQSSNSTAPIILIHANAAPYTTDDGKDIGLEWQYYDGTDKLGFLGWQNTTGSLVYLDAVTDTANVITAGTFGNVQFGQLLLSNTTAATSNVTGALQVKGGVGILGNLHVTRANVGNLSVSGFHVGNMNFAGGDTIYINGSPVVTSATSFNGGTIGLATTFACTTPSTSTTTGAVIVTGGLGVAGNVFMTNVTVINGGNVRANVQGNVFTPAQPYITSLGTLTGLTVSGQLNTNDISPNANNSYSLGTANNDRFLKLWTFDVDMSGTLTGGTVNSTGGTHTGNLAINTSGAAALTTTTAVAELFNNNATTVRIGAGGTTQFQNETQSTSISTGAVVISGGLGIGLNLNVGGAGIFDGNLVAASGTASTDTTTGALVVSGGAGISGAVIAGGNLVAAATTTTADVTTGALVSRGGIAAAGVIMAGGNIVAASGTESTNTTTGALVVSGGAGISGAVIAGGNLVAASDTASTDTTTGALVVVGGAGVSGNLYAAGNVIMGSSTNSNVVVAATTISTSTTTGALVVSGGVGVAGNLNLSAGSTSIIPISFGVGATGGNITGVQQGAIEANLGLGATGTASNVLYFTPTNISSSGEALIPATHYYVLGGNIALWGRSLLNRVTTITEIPLFGNLAAGSPESNAGLWIGNVMLAAGTTYELDMKVHCEANAALTSSNIALKFLGNATVSYIQYDTVFVPARGTVSTAASVTHFYGTGILQGYGAAAQTITAAGTPSNFMIRARGILRVNGQGTLCPTLSFGVAQSTQTISTLAGSYIKWTPVGTAANIAIGTTMGAPWAGGVGY